MSMPPMSSLQSKQKKQKQKKNMQKQRKSAPAGRRRKAKLRRGPNSNLQRRSGVGRMNAYGNQTTNRRNGYIAEDEFIIDINGSVGFSTTSFAVNPGQPSVFPWASRSAAQYSEYCFEMLEFMYKPEVTGFATQGQTGKVILSFDYDATAAVPTTKQQVEAADPHADDLPCEPLHLVIDCAQIHKGDAKFVRVGAQPANTDLKTYDAGILSVSTIGQANTTLVGELHVRYRIRLEKPLLDPAVVVGGAVHFSGTVPTTADNFATMVLQSGGTPTLTGITAAANVITFPAGIPGNYLVSLALLAGTSGTALSAAFSAGATALPLFTFTTRDNSAITASAAATAGTWVTHQAAVTVAVTGAKITYTPSTLVGGVGSDLFITSLPVSLITSATPLVSSELHEMRALVAEMRSLRARVDSDFEDDCPMPPFGKMHGSSECASSSSSAPSLSDSTLVTIGELIARKAARK